MKMRPIGILLAMGITSLPPSPYYIIKWYDRPLVDVRGRRILPAFVKRTINFYFSLQIRNCAINEESHSKFFLCAIC